MTTPEMPDSLNGTFWQSETPACRVPGEVTFDDHDRPTLKVLGRIFDERSWIVNGPTKHGGVTVGYTGNAEDVVDDFLPRNIIGELSDGRPISLVEAQGGKKNEAWPLQYRQQFGVRHVVMDEHVDGPDQLYASVKFRVGGPHHWGANEAKAVTSGGGWLRLHSDADRRRWFEFIPAAPLTIAEIDTRVINPIETLTSLATRNAAFVSDMHVRIDTGSPWRRVHRQVDSTDGRHRPLIEAAELTAEQFASWIDLRQHTDGLDAGALDSLDGVAIQTQVLAFCAIAEGLHWRLFDDKKRVPSLGGAEIRQLRRTARQAALEKLESLDRTDAEPLTDQDREDFAQAINDAFSFINEQTFRSRMQDLVSDAGQSVPQIAANFADWSSAVAYARNTLAHSGTEPQSDLRMQFYDLLIALSYSVPWVLRTVLLRRAGVDAARIQRAYAESSAYNHYIANAKNLLAGGPYAAQK